MGWVRFCFDACGVGFVVLAFCGFDLVGCVVWGGFDWFLWVGLRLSFVSLGSWFSGFGFGFLGVVVLDLLVGVTSAGVLVVGDLASGV